MIEHYIVLKATYGDEKPNVSIDHHMLLQTVGGIVYDTSSGSWISPYHLSDVDAKNDSDFIYNIGKMLLGNDNINYGAE